MDVREPVTVLKGIGPKKAEALGRMHIETVEDLMRLFPREYEDRRSVTPIAQLQEGGTVTITATVLRAVQNYYRGGRKQALRLFVSDESGSCQILFFNARYLMRYFREGEQYAFFGKVTRGRSGLQLVHPDFCRAEEREEGIIPVYPLTRGVTQKDMRTWQKQVRPLFAGLEDHLDPEFRRQHRLMELSEALEEMHFPRERRSYQLARYRLIFDELFLMQTGILAVRRRTDDQEGIRFRDDHSEEEYIRSLPYPLTGAQERCTREIMEDLQSSRMMNRLVQGDVGSGKTAVAEIAMFKAVRSGYQAAMMAPTEILARQHYEGFCTAFAKFGIRVGFLSGSQKAAERRSTLEDLREGSIDILVGTHAVIRPDVVFSKLGLVITDEQHRFGVDQRVSLSAKGEDPNILVMTATPIPRTLAVILYGDLDISVIDEMPPGRKPVKTRMLRAKDREKCYAFAERKLAEGRQMYVVAPLIDMSETLDIRSAQEVADELTERFDGAHGHGAYRVSLLHGAMKQAEKDAVMEAFYRGGIDVLVSTVVIEVGINVPNASVMIIENSERFGLAQMHQLRGRVGRGSDQAYCFLILDGGSEVSEQRGRIMEASSDGFMIAEEDLKLRGPGDLFGTRQHGLPELAMADLVRHGEILSAAKDAAGALLEEDPALRRPEHSKLKDRILRMFGGRLTLDL